MGYMRHHSIVVTSFSKNAAYAAQGRAFELGMAVTEMVESLINSYYTFLVGPDGSKLGWGHDIKGDEQRAEFIKYLKNQKYEDGSTPLEWVEVQYGDENNENHVVSASTYN